MPIEAHAESQNLVVVRISGILQADEVAEAQNTALEIVRERGNVSALIVLEQFEGWERSSNWGDLTLLTKLDRHTEKIAMVGEERWRDDMLMFEAAGLRKSEIRYFNDEAAARAWLAARPS
ncbi:MAG TPA: STAS/SEC14 domain-containing protein [Candidatus Margulisiibacteriota bacterium]|nr:STAS/SEC14 domain-containing protein [Candidatus Margulisiibacteriota bacterium]